MQDDYRKELIDRFVTVVEQLNRLMHSGRLDEWQGLDMTIPQVKILVMLEHLGPLRMGVISSNLGSALSATTSIVDRLVEKELVKRLSDPNDRRVVICDLTASGREATDRFWRIGRERALKTSEVWDLEQFESVVKSLELIHRTGEQILKNASKTQSSG